MCHRSVLVSQRRHCTAFGRYWPHNQGQLLNAAQLAAGLGLSGQTVARYLDIMGQSAAGSPPTAMGFERAKTAGSFAESLRARHWFGSRTVGCA